MARPKKRVETAVTSWDVHLEIQRLKRAYLVENRPAAIRRELAALYDELGTPPEERFIGIRADEETRLARRGVEVTFPRVMSDPY